MALVGLAFVACAVMGSASAGTPKVCSETGVTLAVAKKALGANSGIGVEGVSETARCAIQTGVGSKPPSGCINAEATCINADVYIYPAASFASTVATQTMTLQHYGRGVTKTAVSGAGAGAVLFRAKSYGGAENPALIFQAGKYTVMISTPVAGVPPPPAFYPRWEVLARAIYSHLS
jgi:hypothetical protein